MKSKYLIDAILAMRQAEIALGYNTSEQQKEFAQTRLISTRVNLLAHSGIENLEIKIEDSHE